MKLDRTNPLVPLLKNVKLAVKASGHEVQCLWQEYKDRLDWNRNPMSWFISLGELDGCKLTVSLQLATLNGVTVLFYNAMGPVTDYRRMDEWLDVNTRTKRITAPVHTDKSQRFSVDEFAICAQAIAKRSRIALKPPLGLYLHEASEQIDSNRELWRLVDVCNTAKRSNENSKEGIHAFIALRRYLLAMLVNASKSSPMAVMPTGELWNLAVGLVGKYDLGNDFNVLDISNPTELSNFVRELRKASADSYATSKPEPDPT